MSAKFKKGDLVELLSTCSVTPELHVGMIGSIIRYIGDHTNLAINNKVLNSWEIIFPSLPFSTFMADEKYLRLVPGGDEYKDIGSWDEIPYVGELFKRSKQKEKLVIDLSNPF